MQSALNDSRLKGTSSSIARKCFRLKIEATLISTFEVLISSSVKTDKCSVLLSTRWPSESEIANINLRTSSKNLQNANHHSPLQSKPEGSPSTRLIHYSQLSASVGVSVSNWWNVHPVSQRHPSDKHNIVVYYVWGRYINSPRMTIGFDYQLKPFIKSTDCRLPAAHNRLSPLRDWSVALNCLLSRCI